MNDLQMQLLTDLHRSNFRQGPGGTAETQKAWMLTGLDQSQCLSIADIGCGTGATSIQLAKQLNAKITAVDFVPEFLNELQSRASDHGVADRISTMNCSMEELPFADEEFDVIWSEGAIYNIGFSAGVSAWKRFLKPGGKLIVSEITWLTSKRPPALQSYWSIVYPEIDIASAKIAILEQHGYSLEGYFYLPPVCWLDNYYIPLQNGFDAFLERHDNHKRVKEIIESEKTEIALYQKHQQFYSYGMYIAKKR